MPAFASGTFTARGGHPVRWVATGRSGGLSPDPYASLNLATHVGDDPQAVAGNRARVLAELGVEGLAVIAAEHGGRVSVVDAPGVFTGDALVTRAAGLALLALAADCAPIALADPDAGVVAVVHCGWQGLVAGIVPNTIAAMRDQGARSVQAMIGPTICAGCFPVPADRVLAVRQAVPAHVAQAACPDDDPPRIDIAAGVRALLADEGVDCGFVEACPAEHPDLFSYRRDGVCGRQGMIVVR